MSDEPTAEDREIFDETYRALRAIGETARAADNPPPGFESDGTWTVASSALPVAIARGVVEDLGLLMQGETPPRAWRVMKRKGPGLKLPGTVRMLVRELGDGTAVMEFHGGTA